MKICSGKAAAKSGFTLIELSIVLVIIGLIVGGVLVGRELIGAAAIRAQISQIQTFQTAVNTFRVKYGYLPGDLPAAKASEMGLTAGSGATGHGDGNEVIESCVSGGGALGCETTLFWAHLSQMGLISGDFTAGNSFPDSVVTSGVTLNELGRYLPAAKIGRGNYLHTAWGNNRTNHFVLAAVTSVSTGGVYSYSPSITVQEAHNIDVKTDDGLPITGSVKELFVIPPVSHGTVGLNYSAFGFTGLGCFTNGTTGPMVNTYNLSGGGQDCSLLFKFH